jgi:hypothetical protein
MTEACFTSNGLAGSRGDVKQLKVIEPQHGYICPTPRKGKIGGVSRAGWCRPSWFHCLDCPLHLEAIKILKGISPVAWRNINLIGNFDFTTSSTPVDIEALAARYQNQDFWHRSMTEAEGDGPPV